MLLPEPAVLGLTNTLYTRKCRLSRGFAEFFRFFEKHRLFGERAAFVPGWRKADAKAVPMLSGERTKRSGQRGGRAEHPPGLPPDAAKSAKRKEAADGKRGNARRKVLAAKKTETRTKTKNRCPPAKRGRRAIAERWRRACRKNGVGYGRAEHPRRGYLRMRILPVWVR